MSAQVAVPGSPMSKRNWSRLAWSLWALSGLFIALGLALTAFNGNKAPNTSENSDLGPLLIVMELGIATVGALIASRRRDNPIGWIFCLVGLAIAFGDFAGAYAVHALIVEPGSLPAGALMAWAASWLQGPSLLGAFALVFLLFPNGRLLSPRWRFILWLVIAATVALNVLAFKSGPLDAFPSINNPFGIAGDAGAVLNVIGNLAFVLLLMTLVGSAISLLIRFRRARGEERQQLKWIASAAGFVAAAFLVAPLIWNTPALANTELWPILFILAVVSIPISIGIALLKYRLYDIDLLINRTLVYVPLTALLAGLFAASITLSQKLFVALTGQSSDAATVITTLIVVAAFDPLKIRLQHLVDVRFKEAGDPTKQLKAYNQQVRSFVEMMDAEENTRRLLDETVRAFDATGGAVYLLKSGQLELVHAVGDWQNAPQITVPLEQNGARVGRLALGARRGNREYSPQDRALLEQTVAPVAQAIARVEQWNGAKLSG